MATRIRKLTEKEAQLYLAGHGCFIDDDNVLWAMDRIEGEASLAGMMRDALQVLKPPPRPAKH